MHRVCPDQELAWQSVDEDRYDEHKYDEHSRAGLPWLMSGALPHAPLPASAKGGGVVLSMLAVVDVALDSTDSAGRAQAFVRHHPQDEGEWDQLLKSHPALESLAQAVRAWQPSHVATRWPASGMGIELLLAVSCSCCRTSTRANTMSGGGSMCEEREPDEGGGEAQVRNSLLDAARGRFVVWAVPAEVQSSGGVTWLHDILHYALPPHPLHSSSGQAAGPAADEWVHAPEWEGADEWSRSVLDAVSSLHPSPPPPAAAGGGGHLDAEAEEAYACSTVEGGPVLRAVALHVRFRDGLPSSSHDLHVHHPHHDTHTHALAPASSLWCACCVLLSLWCSVVLVLHVAALKCCFLVARLGLARIMHVARMMHVARISWLSSRQEPREAPYRHLPRTHVPLHLPRLLSTLHTARGMCAFGYLRTHTECYPTCTDTEGYPTCAVLWQLNNASAVPAALAALASCVPTIC